MKRFGWIIIVLWLIIAACSPPAAPITTPSPAMPTLPPVQPTAPKAPALSPEEAAWAKVIDEAKKEGKVTLYTFGFTGDIGSSLAKAFNNRYGIKVELISGIGTVLIERVKAERAAGKYIADTLDSATSLVIMAKQDGLTDKVGDLPVLRERDVWTMGPPFSDPDGHIVVLRPAVYSPYVNTTLVRPGEEPRSFLELLEPKWKGKIVIDSPVTSPVPIWVNLVWRKAGIHDDEYWRRLAKQELKIAPSVREPPSWLARGEAHIVFNSADVLFHSLVKDGAPVKPIDIQEGVIFIIGSGLAPLKNAPHPNAARLFINWLLSQEGQTVYTQAVGGFMTLRKDVADIRPAVLRLTPKKIHVLDYTLQLEAARVQREGTLAKLLGLEK